MPKELFRQRGENCRSIKDATLALTDSFFQSLDMLLSLFQEMLEVQNCFRQVVRYQTLELAQNIDTLISNETSAIIKKQLHVAKRKLLTHVQLSGGQSAVGLNGRTLSVWRRQELNRRVKLNQLKIPEEEIAVLQTIPETFRLHPKFPKILPDRQF